MLGGPHGFQFYSQLQRFMSRFTVALRQTRIFSLSDTYFANGILLLPHINFSLPPCLIQCRTKLAQILCAFNHSSANICQLGRFDISDTCRVVRTKLGQLFCMQ
jgi:hypothetical protein